VLDIDRTDGTNLRPGMARRVVVGSSPEGSRPRGRDGISPRKGSSPYDTYQTSSSIGQHGSSQDAEVDFLAVQRRPVRALIGPSRRPSSLVCAIIVPYPSGSPACLPHGAIFLGTALPSRGAHTGIDQLSARGLIAWVNDLSSPGEQGAGVGAHDHYRCRSLPHARLYVATMRRYDADRRTERSPDGHGAVVGSAEGTARGGCLSEVIIPRPTGAEVVQPDSPRPD
jgi:hypothetical protein